MKNKRIIFSLILISILFTTMALYSQTKNELFTTEGIKEFFKIVDILKSDLTPTADEWKRFEDSPGYKELIRDEFGKDYLKQILTVIFKPSEQENEPKIIEIYKKKESFLSFTPDRITGFKEADKHRSEILSFAEYLQSQEVLNDVEKQVSEYLPNAKIDSSFRINFIVFNDSRGWDTIIMGITNPGNLTAEEEACLKNKGLNNRSPEMLVLAHEAFHSIRGRMLAYNESIVKPADRNIIAVLNKIENEGIADLINLKPLNGAGGCLPNSRYAGKIIREQKYQYAIVHTMNYFLSEIAKNVELAPDLGNAMSAIVTRSGHPTGYYMANIIESQLGRSELKRIATNPFQFIISYNKAAMQIAGTPVFSSTAIGLIKKMEAEYLKK